jgi:hypothetical protein
LLMGTLHLVLNAEYSNEIDRTILKIEGTRCGSSR